MKLPNRRGYYNGFGGKLEKGEAPETAMIRECREECGIEVAKYEKMAVQEFFYLETNTIMEVHLFNILEYLGKPIGTEEMAPKWFSFNEIPYENMWSDDMHWMPQILQGKKLEADFIFSEGDKLSKHKINIVENF